jgi:hypothetical protein
MHHGVLALLAQPVSAFRPDWALLQRLELPQLIVPAGVLQALEVYFRGVSCISPFIDLPQMGVMAPVSRGWVKIFLT